MIQMPLKDMINKITEQAGISEEEVNAKITKKLDQLSGLISKEGAAHIIANELGVKLMPQNGGRVNLKDVLMGLRNVEVIGKVTNFFGVREFQAQNRSGKVANFIIADETGTLRIVCWGDQADKASGIREGDIIRVTAGYVKSNNGRNEVHLNDNSTLVINPPGIDVKPMDAQAFERKKISELTDAVDNVEILGTIVQAFDPKFFEVCPQCQKRIRPTESGLFSCSEHGNVTPIFSYLINVYLDDGTGNIQAVFFRNLVESLLGKDQQQVLAIKDNLQAIDQLKEDLLGQMIKVDGRVTKNTMFDRTEFVVRKVDINPDPSAELKSIEKQGPAAESAAVETQDVQ